MLSLALQLYAGMTLRKCWRTWCSFSTHTTFPWKHCGNCSGTLQNTRQIQCFMAASAVSVSPICQGKFAASLPLVGVWLRVLRLALRRCGRAMRARAVGRHGLPSPRSCTGAVAHALSCIADTSMPGHRPCWCLISCLDLRAASPPFWWSLDSGLAPSATRPAPCSLLRPCGWGCCPASLAVSLGSWLNSPQEQTSPAASWRHLPFWRCFARALDRSQQHPAAALPPGELQLLRRSRGCRVLALWSSLTGRALPTLGPSGMYYDTTYFVQLKPIIFTRSLPSEMYHLFYLKIQ